MHAEAAYLFRHALLRDAAYQLQMPADRARLHGLVVALIEQLCGGRPEQSALEVESASEFTPHLTDEFASELAVHCAAADAHSPGAFRGIQRTYVIRAALIAERGFQVTEAARLWLELASISEGVERGEATRRAAEAFSRGGRPQVATIHAQSALETANLTGSARLEAAALGVLGNASMSMGETKVAREFLEKALAVRAALGDLRGRQVALGSMGQAAALSADYPEALKLMTEAMELGIINGENRIWGSLLQSLAQLRQEMGQLDEAESTYERALTFSREHQLRRTEGSTLGGLGTLYRKTKRTALAKETLQKAIAIHAETGNRASELNTRANLALVLLELEDWQGAESILIADIAASEEAGLASKRAVSLGNLGGLYFRMNRFLEAESAYTQALQEHRRMQNKRFLGLHLCDFAATLAAMRQGSRARDAWQEGSAIIESLKLEPLLPAKRDALLTGCKLAGIEPWV